MEPRFSLARGAAPSPPGTLHARSLVGALRAEPRPGRTVTFGRGTRPEVQLGVGVDDLRVSRRHGELTFRRRRWWLRNTGQQLVRLPRGRLLHTSTEPVPLEGGYTPLFVRGSGHREHLVELYVTDYETPVRVARQEAETLPPKRWELDPDEELLLVVLGQHYLRYEENPRPLTYRQAAELLAELRPQERWTQPRIRHRIEAVRHRLARTGQFPYPLLREGTLPGPADADLLHNLLRGLVESTSLVPPALRLLDD